MTVPNILSFLRILLIPLMVVLYCRDKNYYAAVGVVALSGLTDAADGFIARRWNMASEFGKFLDPLADKLTQAAMILCLISRHSWMVALITLLAVKECFQFVLGYAVLRVTDTMCGAKWFGKLSTATLYVVMILLFLFPNIPKVYANALIGVCGVTLSAAMLLYGRMLFQILQKQDFVKQSGKTLLLLWKYVLLFDWVAMAALLVCCLGDVSIASILAFTPKMPLLAAVVLLLLYAVKSMSVVVFIGFLYAACGMLLPLPAALLVDLGGTMLAAIVPYYIGKRTGMQAVTAIMTKFPRLQAVGQRRIANDFLFALTVRFLGGLPMDAASLTMGAMGVGFPAYLTGSVLGLAPRMLIYSVIGMYAKDIRSPAFIIAASAELLILATTALVNWRNMRKSTI